MSDPGAEHFVSKRDLWLSVLVWFGVLVTVTSCLAALRSGNPSPAETGFVSVVATLIVGFILVSFYGTHYTLRERELSIRAGLFHWRIPLEEIVEVRPTRNPLSAPAASLDRLELRREGRWARVMISPLEKERFLRALQERVPELRREGDRLVRSGARES